jgi:hypothetical protein
MVAMIQQFFMVNSFCQALLMVDDQKEPNMVEVPDYCNKKLTLDDNVIH